MKKIVIALILAVSTQSAQASGVVAGATEFTQIMNNSELMASVATESGIYSTNLQQYITQISQLARMDQNLLQLPESVIRSRMGSEWSNVAPFIQAYQSSIRLQTSADQVSRDQAADIQAMRTGGMSPSQYYGHVKQRAAAGDAYWKDAESTELLHMQQLQERARAVEDLNAQVPEIDGTVKGFHHLALQAGRTQALMIDQQMQYSRTTQMQIQDRAATEQRRLDGADAAKSYDEARKAEKAGIQNAFSYPSRAK